MASGTGELRKLADRFAKAAEAPIATDAVDMLADIYIRRAAQVMGRDTGQLFRRTRKVAVTGTGRRATAVLEADTPYAGFHNYGNPWTGPNRFWDEGMEAAERAVAAVNGSMMSGIERMLTSGGVWNPRRIS